MRAIHLLLCTQVILASLVSCSVMKDYLSKEELDGIDESPEEEVALAQSPGSTGGFNFAFSAFGESFNLQLQKNEKILSPTAQIVSRSGDKIENIGVKGSDCHYIHRGDDFVASISLCGNNSAHGYITTSDGRTFEIGERNKPQRKQMLKIKRAHIPSVSTPSPSKHR
ncbi:A disintegrin and metalloproteinase with thrombospondin motifs 7, partial [Caligus rogercresseyi]